MSREKECKCCHEWWYASVIKEDLCPNCYDYFKQLKQQLAEKDKEIERLNTIKNNAIECADLFKVALSVRQKDLAIQELEKVKNFVDGRTYCANYIKKRIKELKGEKDVKD